MKADTILSFSWNSHINVLHTLIALEREMLKVSYACSVWSYIWTTIPHPSQNIPLEAGRRCQYITWLNLWLLTPFKFRGKKWKILIEFPEYPLMCKCKFIEDLDNFQTILKVCRIFQKTKLVLKKPWRYSNLKNHQLIQQPNVILDLWAILSRQ